MFKNKPKMNFRPNKHEYYRHYKSLLEKGSQKALKGPNFESGSEGGEDEK